MKKEVNSQIEQWSILSDNIVYVKSKDRDIMNGIDIKLIETTENIRECIEEWIKKEEKGEILILEKVRKS